MSTFWRNTYPATPAGMPLCRDCDTARASWGCSDDRCDSCALKAHQEETRERHLALLARDGITPKGITPGRTHAAGGALTSEASAGRAAAASWASVAQAEGEVPNRVAEGPNLSVMPGDAGAAWVAWALVWFVALGLLCMVGWALWQAWGGKGAGL